MREQRHWLVTFPVRFLAEIVVLVLLAGAVLSYQFDLGERWFGWGTADPATEPAAVAPPEGLKLPATGAAPVVAHPSRTVPGDPARVAAVVQPMLRKRVLGRHFGVLVTDLRTGRPLFRSGAPTVTPASTTKLLTSTAALEHARPDGPVPHHGALPAGQPPAGAGRRRRPVPGELAQAGRGQLPRPRRRRDPRPARGREAARDEGRARPAGLRRLLLLRSGGQPALARQLHPRGASCPRSARCGSTRATDADGYGFVPDPAAARRAGLPLGAGRGRPAGRAPGEPGDRRPPRRPRWPRSRARRSARSCERTLEVSDNQAAEVLARHVGLAEQQEGSFEAGTACCPRGAPRARRTRRRATGCTTAAGSRARTVLTHRHPRRGGPARDQPRPPRAARGADRACRSPASPAR